MAINKCILLLIICILTSCESDSKKAIKNEMKYFDFRCGSRINENIKNNNFSDFTFLGPYAYSEEFDDYCQYPRGSGWRNYSIFFITKNNGIYKNIRISTGFLHAHIIHTNENTYALKGNFKEMTYSNKMINIISKIYRYDTKTSYLYTNIINTVKIDNFKRANEVFKTHISVFEENIK